MNTAAADRIAKAVLYEGYMLYPYRPSAIKNQQRFNFGVVSPRAFSEAQKGSDRWTIQTECLVQGNGTAEMEVRVRFLQLVDRSVEERIASRFEAAGAPHGFSHVKSLTVEGQTHYSWQEAVERELDIAATDLETLIRRPVQRPFHFSAGEGEEVLRDKQARVLGRIMRTQNAIDGLVEVQAREIAEGVFKIAVIVQNVTSIIDAAQVSREHTLLRSLVSAHVVLRVEGGGFVSLLDPPQSLRAIAAGCRNEGTFPVLVGADGQRDTVLASPVILYDYPQIAPESAGDLFDGTEVDEILSLRIMTMTDEEKREMRESDERARQILERTESMPAEQFMKLHGALRGLRPINEDAR